LGLPAQAQYFFVLTGIEVKLREIINYTNYIFCMTEE